MAILLVRSLLGSVTYYGPFADNAAAIAWAENNFHNQNWWIEPIIPVPSK